MSSQSLEKPFWIKPPWMILFDIIRLHKIHPWDVNLTHLLNSFIGEMKKRGFIDFPAAGTALLSSSIIYRIQSEAVMQMEEPPKIEPPKPPEYLPPPLQIPFRHELSSTTINSLIKALEEALRIEKLGRLPPTQTVITPPRDLLEGYDSFFVEIEDKIEEFYAKLKTGDRLKITSFTKLVEGMDELNRVRVFLILLFLAQSGLVNLWQEEEFGEIQVMIPPEGEEHGTDGEIGSPGTPARD